MLALDKTLVRPHLEYTVCQHGRRVIRRIEICYKRYRDDSPQWYQEPRVRYEDRNRKLGLWSLEEWWQTMDLVVVFKMARGFSALSLQFLLQIDSMRKTRKQSYKPIQHHCNNDIRKYFFSNRVISKWNKLDEETVSADIGAGAIGLYPRGARALPLSRMEGKGGAQGQSTCRCSAV